jgi:hypothetical protein
MKLISQANNKVIIEFTQHELHLANILIQEGRISYECDSPAGQALEDSVRSVLIMVKEATKAGQNITSCH